MRSLHNTCHSALGGSLVENQSSSPTNLQPYLLSQLKKTDLTMRTKNNLLLFENQNQTKMKNPTSKTFCCSHALPPGASFASQRCWANRLAAGQSTDEVPWTKSLDVAPQREKVWRLGGRISWTNQPIWKKDMRKSNWITYPQITGKNETNLCTKPSSFSFPEKCTG